MSEERFLGGLVPIVRVVKRRTTEAQRVWRRGVTSDSVPFVPLWLKGSDKDVILLWPLIKIGSCSRNCLY